MPECTKYLKRSVSDISLIFMVLNAHGTPVPSYLRFEFLYVVLDMMFFRYLQDFI